MLVAEPVVAGVAVLVGVSVELPGTGASPFTMTAEDEAALPAEVATLEHPAVTMSTRAPAIARHGNLRSSIEDLLHRSPFRSGSHVHPLRSGVRGACVCRGRGRPGLELEADELRVLAVRQEADSVSP